MKREHTILVINTVINIIGAECLNKNEFFIDKEL